MNSKQKFPWLSANQVCIAQGNSVALNLMFETKADHQIFLTLWERYLGGMTEVLNYHLSPIGWTVLFRTKSSSEISNSFQELRKKSKKATKEIKDIGRMLSEHFRILISQYVRRTNQLNGRKGTKVMHRFKRFVLNSIVDYNRAFQLLIKAKDREVHTEKYQADRSKYDVKEEMNDESGWKSGKCMYHGDLAVFDVLRCVRLVRPNSPVLRNWLKNSKSPPQISKSP